MGFYLPPIRPISILPSQFPAWVRFPSPPKEFLGGFGRPPDDLASLMTDSTTSLNEALKGRAFLGPMVGFARLLLPLLVFAAGAQAQVGGTIGRVTDIDGDPISGATISVEQNRFVTTADSQGEFRLPELPSGIHEILVTAIGYQPHLIQHEVGERAGDDLFVQLQSDAIALDGVLVSATRLPGAAHTAPDVMGTLVLAGTKSTIIQLANLPANLAEKTGRQVFSRVPGAFVYDMDGSGNQMNVSTRGLDAHRSWELNVRQDGVLLNSDMYGYPASHYSPPMEAIESIEMVRGTAALQYGSQFGGLVNYVTKSPDPGEEIGFESINTLGSFGLRSTYNAAGGTAGPLTFYAYMNERVSDGYRDAARSEYSAQYLAGTMELSPRLRLRGQVGHSTYVYQLPGPLNDAMFVADPTQAPRTRNYYNPDITVPAISLDWDGQDGTQFTARLSAVLGPRSSVQFVGLADRPDGADSETGMFAPRQVDIDRYNSYTAEFRFVRPWVRGGLDHMLAVGATASHNDMHRRQQGVGTTGADYDLTVTGVGFGRDVRYKTANGAVYVENLFRLGSRWSIVPGARVELGRTRLLGRLAYYDPADTPRQIDHEYPLVGIRTSYRSSVWTELYGGWSQAYRPQIMKDVLPANELERTDPDLDDSRGWTFEAGIRGSIGSRLIYDVNLFELRANDRFGTVLRTDTDGSFYLFRTTVGSSRTRGVEASLEALLLQIGGVSLRVHTATSYFDGRYLSGTVASGDQNVDIAGKRIESVPEWISRSGLALDEERFSANLLVSYVSDSFADPLNTVEPPPNGAVGVVPAYTVVDLNAAVQATEWLRLRVGVNNLFDEMYFTKRPQFYPGPGVWPSDGRGAQFSVELQR